MRHCVAALFLCAASIASAQGADAGFRQVASEEPFMGAPLGVGFAKGGLGFSWGTGAAVAVFDVKSGEAKGEFTGHGSAVTAGAGCPGARLVATGDAAGVVRIWDPGTRKERIKIDVRPSPVRTIAWGPTGAHIAVVTEDRTLTVWRVENGGRVFDEDLPASGESDLQFSPDGERFVLLRRSRSERDGNVESSLQVKEFDLTNGGRAKRKGWDRRDAGADAFPYAGARADARSRRVALVDGDEVVIWSIEDEREVCRLDGGADAVAWRKDGKLLLSRTRELVLANAVSGKIDKRWPGIDGITWMVASDDNRAAVGGGSRGGAFWNLAAGDGAPQDIGAVTDAVVGKLVIVARDPAGHGTAIRTDDGTMAAADGDPPDPATGLPGISVSLEDDSVLYVSDGRPVVHSFASASDVPCGEPRSAPVVGVLCAGENVAAWGAASWTLRDPAGKELARGPGRPVKAAGRWLAVRAGRGLFLFDANSGKAVVDYPDAEAFDLAGDSIAVLDDGEAIVFNLARNREPFRVSAARASDIALSPDGTLVAFDNGAVATWDVARAKKTSTSDLRGPLAGLRFHPGGAMLAALSQAGEFRLLNEDGTTILQTTQASLPDANGSPFSFSPDGTRMVVAWTDGLRFYQLDPEVKATVLKGTSGSPEFAPHGDRWLLRKEGRIDMYEGSDRIESLSGEATFFPDGRVAVADRAGLRVWDGRWRGTVSTDEATSISVSGDGKRIAAASGAAMHVFEK